MKIISKHFLWIMLVFAVTGSWVMASSYFANLWKAAKEAHELVPPRYQSDGAYVPYADVDSTSLEKMTTDTPPKSISSAEEKAILQDVQQLLDYLNYLPKNVFKPDKKIIDTIKTAEKTLQQASEEGIGKKGYGAFVRAIDAIVSVATHFLTQKPNSETKDKLKNLLSLILPRMKTMSGKDLESPYWNNVARNLAIASQILGITLALK
jgi:hypothetical protein